MKLKTEAKVHGMENDKMMVGIKRFYIGGLTLSDPYTRRVVFHFNGRHSMRE